jgi:DNA-binding transcriptional regulator YdaS (Cro superfamily)
MTLSDWLKKTGTTQAALGSLIGKSQGYVAKIVSNGTSSLDVALAIHDATDGQVAIESLRKPTPSKADAA